MRTKRLIRMRGRKGKRKNVDVDITSLLDILVILLVFLLRSYNDSGIIVTIPEGITVPFSNSNTRNTAGVIVQVAPQKIWVDNKVVLDTSEQSQGRIYDHGGRRIIPLYDALVKKREASEVIKQNVAKAVPFSGTVNLVIDKTLKYDYLKKLMYTAAEAGYKKYKFVVMGEQ